MSLSGYKLPTYSLHISANVRLIIELQSTDHTVHHPMCGIFIP